jgi:hypothetical protein
MPLKYWLAIFSPNSDSLQVFLALFWSEFQQVFIKINVIQHKPNIKMSRLANLYAPRAVNLFKHIFFFITKADKTR